MSKVLHSICCEVVLASLGNDALTVSEAAVALENGGQPIDLFPHTLRTAKQKNLVCSNAVTAAKDELKQKLMAAELVLEAKDIKIEECELALATERQRVVIYQDERDRAIAERCKAEADLKAVEQLYGNLFGMLERFRLPTDIKRKGNGATNSNGKHRIDGGIAENGAEEAIASVSA